MPLHSPGGRTRRRGGRRARFVSWVKTKTDQEPLIQLRNVDAAVAYIKAEYK